MLARCSSGISLAISDRAADTALVAFAAVPAAGGQVALDTNGRSKLRPPSRAAALTRHAMPCADVVFPGAEDVRFLWGMTNADAILD